MKFSVSMEDYLLTLKALIKFENSIEFKKFLMKELCVICSGQTLMKEWGGECLQEEQGTLLDKTFQKLSIEQMDLSLLLEHIN